MKCNTCGTPQHLFFKDQCPKCHTPPQKNLEWYALQQVAEGRDPRDYNTYLLEASIHAILANPLSFPSSKPPSWSTT